MTEKHLLISRIVDREDSPEDWAGLDSLADRDRNTWQDLVQSLRDDALVRQAVSGPLAVADHVALPATTGRNGRGLASMAIAVSGWLAAAALLLLWWGGLLDGTAEQAGPGFDSTLNLTNESGGNPGPGEEFTGPDGSDKARALARLAGAGAKGEVGKAGTLARLNQDVENAEDKDQLAELPSLLIEARPVPGTKRTEVLYVRRTLERVVVDDAYRVGVDDGGRPVAVPTDLKRYMPTRVY